MIDVIEIASSYLLAKYLPYPEGPWEAVLARSTAGVIYLGRCDWTVIVHPFVFDD